MNPVDQLAFVVGLAKIHGEVERGGAFEACLLDICQRLMAVDFRLAQAEQVEVRSIEDQNRWIAGQTRGVPLVVTREAYSMERGEGKRSGTAGLADHRHVFSGVQRW